LTVRNEEIQKSKDNLKINSERQEIEKAKLSETLMKKEKELKLY